MKTRLFTLLLGVAACSRDTSGGATDSAAGDVANDPPTRVARLSAIDGTVSLQAPGSDSWTQPTQNYTLSTGDRLYAGPASHAELDFGSGAIRLDHGGDITVTNLSDSFTQLGLDQGALEASLYKYDQGDSLELDTPNGALVPTKAGTYVVSIDSAGGGTVVDVQSGEIEVTGPGLNQTLNSGQVVRLVGTNPIQEVSLDGSYAASQPAFSDLDRWRATRDPLFLSDGYASRYVSPTTPGWEDLDDNGVWVTDEASVHVWCPTRVSSSWVPYRAGRWSWVEPWGWTWVSDEPWGYAPFHYGRWETVTTNECKSSWAWIPGPVVAQPVWAPALVAFVDGSALQLTAGPNVEAWFPLGPREPFFPWYHHSDAYLHDVNATNLIEVRDVPALIRDEDLRNVRRINRDNALTAVPSLAFASGEPVERHAIEMRSDLLPPIRIAAHPSVNPRADLLAGGPAAARPRIAERPEMVVTRAAQHGAAPRELAQRAPSGQPRGAERGPVVNAPRGALERPAPVVVRNPANAERREQAPLGGEVALRPTAKHAAPPPSSVASGGRRVLIGRNEAPASRPSPAQRQSAMQAHPGRPLEPRQIENLRSGKPAGEPQDHEVPSHPARVASPPPRERPQAQARSAAPQRPQVQPRAQVQPPPQPQHAAPPRPQQRPQPQQQPRQQPRPQPAARPAPSRPAPSSQPQRGKPGRGGGAGGDDSHRHEV